MTQTHCIFRVLSPGVLVCDHCGRQHKTTTPIERIKPRRCRDFVRGAPTPAEHTEGPGTEAHKIFEALGQKPKSGCNCGKHTKQMNDWGTHGCREHREIVFSWWTDSYQQTTWRERITAAGIAAKNGWTWALTWEGILEEAIRRAEGRPEEAEPLDPVGDPRAANGVLLDCSGKGLGDQFFVQVVARHLHAIGVAVDVRCKPGCEPLFSGVCREAGPAVDNGPYQSYHACQCLPPASAADGRSTIPAGELAKLGIAPDQSLMGYVIPAEPTAHPEFPHTFVLLHHEGASDKPQKNPQHVAMAKLCEALHGAGVAVLLIDRAGESPLRGMPGVIAADWLGVSPVDIAAVARRAALCVGIDSGPGHVMQASGAQTVIVWTGHHPAHFAPPDMPNVTHLLPVDSHLLLKPGDRIRATAWFRAHYQYEVYTDLDKDLPAQVLRMLADEPQSAERREAITAIVPQGIGDVFWVHRLLHPHFEKVNYRVRVARGHRADVQRRLAGWPATWPGAGDVTFEEGTEGQYHEMMQRPYSVKELLARYDAGQTVQEFSVNQFLEHAVTLESIEPGLPVAWEFREPDDWPHTLKLERLPLPWDKYVCLYVCGSTRQNKPGGHDVWSVSQWVDFVSRVVWRHMPIVLLGAPYDADVLSEIKSLLEYDNGYFCDLRTNVTPPQALSIIHRSRLFISYQSGLAILADHWNHPQIKLYFDDEKHRNLKWSWPHPHNRQAEHFHCRHFSESPADVANSVPESLRIRALDPHTAACLKWLPDVWSVPGDIAEMGVSAGRNLFPLAEWAQQHAAGRMVYALDSFRGVEDFGPADSGSTMHVGDWAASESLFDSRAARYPNIVKVVGRVQDTLPSFDARLAFCWLDMDLYEPMRLAWTWLQDHTSPGAIVGMHDWGRPQCPGVAKLVDDIDLTRWEIIDKIPDDTCIFFRRLK